MANSFDETLIVRSADMRLKERQPLVLLVREAPLHVGHLRLMTAAAEAGAIVFPPITAMYVRPKTVEEIVDHTSCACATRSASSSTSRPDGAGVRVDEGLDIVVIRDQIS